MFNKQEYEASAEGKAAHKKYASSAKGKAAHKRAAKRYRLSRKGKRTERLYITSAIGRAHIKVSNGRYAKSAKGRAAKKRKRTPTYSSWEHMNQRCNNPHHKRFIVYGAIGVKVCRRWLKFENFLADMGSRPTGTTLGRFGDVGGYNKHNCKWMTRREQLTEAAKKRKHNGSTFDSRSNLHRNTQYQQAHRP